MVFSETQPLLMKLEKFQDVIKLLKVTRDSLYKGIEAAVVGNRIGDIGYAVQNYVKVMVSVVREVVGHGVGANLHESPEVPNYGKRGALNYKKDWLSL